MIDINVKPGDLVKITNGSILFVSHVLEPGGEVCGFADPGKCEWRYIGGKVSDLLISGRLETTKDVNGHRLSEVLNGKESEAIRQQMIAEYHKKEI